jgi:hypothetical protein
MKKKLILFFIFLFLPICIYLIKFFNSKVALTKNLNTNDQDKYLFIGSLISGINKKNVL